MAVAAVKVTSDERKSKLSRALAYAVSQGGIVESQAEYVVVVSYGVNKPVNHVLHLLLTIVTGGFWIIVWIFLILTHKRPQRDVITVDEYGNLRFQRVQAQQ